MTSVNLDNLKTIKDKNTAYTLGYLCWAGYRKNKYDKLAVQVLKSEKADLTTIKNTLNVKNSKVKSQNQSLKLVVTSKGLVDTLNKWYVPKDSNKSLPKVPKEFVNHFIRGFFERHGYTNYRSQYVRFTVPNKEFAVSLVNLLKKHDIYSSYFSETTSSGNICHRVFVNSTSVTSLYNWMYTGVKRNHRRRSLLKLLSDRFSVRNERHKKRIEAILSWVRELDEDGLSANQIARQVGTNKQNVINYRDYLDL